MTVNISERLMTTMRIMYRWDFTRFEYELNCEELSYIAIAPSFESHQGWAHINYWWGNWDLKSALCNTSFCFHQYTILMLPRRKSFQEYISDEHAGNHPLSSLTFTTFEHLYDQDTSILQWWSEGWLSKDIDDKRWDMRYAIAVHNPEHHPS